MYKNILLGVDSSKNARRAAARVIDLYEPGITKITAFHSYKHHLVPRIIPIAVPNISPSTYTMPEVDYKEIEEHYKLAGQKILGDIKELFLNAKIDIETRLIRDEEPEDYIERITKKENFDLVVLGCKGDHSKLKEIFMGSIAQEVLNSDVPADVLAVR